MMTTDSMFIYDDHGLCSDHQEFLLTVCVVPLHNTTIVMIYPRPFKNVFTSRLSRNPPPCSEFQDRRTPSSCRVRSVGVPEGFHVPLWSVVILFVSSLIHRHLSVVLLFVSSLIHRHVLLHFTPSRHVHHIHRHLPYLTCDFCVFISLRYLIIFTLLCISVLFCSCLRNSFSVWRTPYSWELVLVLVSSHPSLPVTRFTIFVSYFLYYISFIERDSHKFISHPRSIVLGVCGSLWFLLSLNF